ncbi:hypothetical protein D3C71_1793310 [compost metagenome]
MPDIDRLANPQPVTLTLHLLGRLSAFPWTRLQPFDRHRERIIRVVHVNQAAGFVCLQGRDV